MEFLTAPPAAGVEKIVDIQCFTGFEDDETAAGHFLFERVDHAARRWVLGRQVDAGNCGPDGIEREDSPASFLDRLDA